MPLRISIELQTRFRATTTFDISGVSLSDGENIRFSLRRTLSPPVSGLAQRDAFRPDGPLWPSLWGTFLCLVTLVKLVISEELNMYTCLEP